jgi:GT2 family glycosyltransferase
MAAELQSTRGESDTTVGVVIIGRNEGDRLKRCLESVGELLDRVVYVDSGSTDGSVDLAESVGATVVRLDMTLPFTAARARNTGFATLLRAYPELAFVFFVDGDCEVERSFLGAATRFLTAGPDVAAVAGRRRERYPERSIYNRLCDIEWNVPAGETKSCGGDVLMRVEAFKQVNGYRSDMICGEEPELCVRLRRAGWRIWRLPDDMTLHDAAIHRFSQWWRRSMRAGYGFALGSYIHGAPPERHWVAESRRAWIWGLGIPLVALISAALVGWRAMLLLILYPLQVLRLGHRNASSEGGKGWWWAGAMVLGKFPESLGQIKFQLDQLMGKRSELIEYK